jgi:4-hydroxybenzoate polyprenyltransferase
MISKSSLLHFRLPFSFFLLPIYLLALVSARDIDPVKAWMVFFVLHFLLYTASNGFNSYYDRDEESIGTLKFPPAVTPDLVFLSLALDAAAIVLALNVGWMFACGCFLYGLASKAYSWQKIRIKKYPVLGWLFTGIGQGSLTFLLVAISISNTRPSDILAFHLCFPAIATGLFVLGFYPLTQIYQHAEDSRRHDKTISLALGTRRTFFLAAVFMVGSLFLFCCYFSAVSGIISVVLFIVSVVPAAIYFLLWFFKTIKDKSKADYAHAMRMCIMTSGGLNAFLSAYLFLIPKNGY